jgi:hypothetical protein
MVVNSNIVLDSGELKYFNNIIMEPEHLKQYKSILRDIYDIKNKIKQEFWLQNSFQGKNMDKRMEASNLKIERLNEKLKLYNDDTLKHFDILDGCDVLRDIDKIKDSSRISKIMNVIPFYPSVMINISPGWKGDFGKNDLTDKLMVKNFCKVIDSYLNESTMTEKRFTKYKYCLECGSGGDFLHAHIVAEINPKIIKSMKSHFSKNGHNQQLQKYWKKYFKGGQGPIKGKYAISRNLINNRIMLEDKLAYLIESNKQEGHQNSRDLNLTFGDF